MIRITTEKIVTETLLRAVQSPAAGAVVLFLGTTREFTQGRRTLTLHYECYSEMALRKMRELAAKALEIWPLVSVAMEHRIGEVPLGEASVAIAVSAGHRQEAFDAGEWLINTLKQEVPIWKREHWEDGSTEWVHPGVKPSSITESSPGAQP